MVPREQVGSKQPDTRQREERGGGRGCEEGGWAEKRTSKSNDDHILTPHWDAYNRITETIRLAMVSVRI